MHFADKAFIAETTAKMLLEVKDKPFVFTSGWASPVYIDKLIFYPRIRSQLVAVATPARDPVSSSSTWSPAAKRRAFPMRRGSPSASRCRCNT